MKILVTVALAMFVSASVFAGDCVENDKCSAEDCAKLGKDFSLNEAKLCVKIGVTQNTSTACAGMVDNGRTAQTDKTDKASDKSAGSENTRK
jgi:hypothetical protein